MPSISRRLFELRARAADLGRVTELKRLDLGRDADLYEYYPCGLGSESSSKKKKTIYPSLCVYRVSTPLEFPDSGKATIEYKVTSKTTRTRDGKQTHDADIEIHSIDPVMGKKKVPSVRKIKLLAAIAPGMIQLDDRPRNGSGQFSPQGDGGPDPHAMRAAYGPGTIAKTVAGVGAAAGLGGLAAARGGNAMRALLSKLKR